jgi:filamentous hemagglutinin family protein
LNTQVSEPIAVGGQTQYNITGGTRPGGGANLFHSFGDFGVPTNHIANFLNTPVDGVLPATSNILARVTGNIRSDIFGTIQTTDFGNANLFLLNPAGFLFGPNAAVHVGGMVAFTSADYLKLTDNARFNTIPNAAVDALLTAMPVTSFGFLGSNPGAITVRGSQFSVTDGQSISLVGGDISIESGTPEGGTTQTARLSAPNGNILLASATSPGEFDATTLQLLPNVNDTSFSSFGSVFLAPESSINVRGTSTVSIRGGQFVLSVNDAVMTTSESTPVAETVSLTSLSRLITSTSAQGKGGTILVSVEDTINIVDSSISANSNSTDPDAGSGGQVTLTAPTINVFGGNISTLTLGSGNAGDIQIQAGTFRLDATENAFGLVEATTSGSGHGGNISILGIDGPGSRANNVILSNFSSVRSETIHKGAGTAGNITVDTMRLALREGSEITTASHLNSPGNAGNVTLDASESVLVSGSFVTSDVLEASTGNGGQVTIKTPNLIVNQGSDGTHGQISTSTGSSRDAGSVTINADSVTLTNGGRLISSSFLDDPIFPPATGAAGTVVVQGLNGAGTLANSVTISGQDGSGAASGIFTDTKGTGPGGNIFVNANSVTLQNGGTLSAKTSGSATTASGGLITVNATDHVIMTDDASITASSTGHGNAGNILINAGRAFVATNSKSAVTTQADTASGGNITVLATDMVHLTNSHISASVADGSGGGGNISIDPQSVILQNSQILAQAAQGQGGAITITTNLFLPDANSIVNADSGSGLNGTVTIQSPNAPASGKIQPLGNTPLQATSLLNQHCAALAGGDFSSFTVAGRDSLPAEPSSWLASPLVFGLTKTGDTLTEKGGGHTGIDGTAARETTVLSMRQIAPAGFLTHAFAVESSSGCQS